MMPPKFLKLAANYLGRPLSQSINNSIKKGLFPENAQVASVTLIDKKTDDKNSLLNFCPISVFKLLLKSVRKHTKNTTRGKIEELRSENLECLTLPYKNFR